MSNFFSKIWEIIISSYFVPCSSHVDYQKILFDVVVTLVFFVAIGLIFHRRCYGSFESKRKYFLIMIPVYLLIFITVLVLVSMATPFLRGYVACGPPLSIL